ncbi:MAG: 2-C-methyl-D-erythritol 2,4-cyclodiphosphate synthase [Cryomorphaceae bacterium]|nr:MAG: 2-C-methyl-D-erythritol 2,4-cyclodiphosphate synthase [Cryomorphaceae bacterium]
MKIRVGFGYDVHELREGHPFWIGGVQLEHHKGAYGHSDADVLLHAICDAILGALSLRDIGYHFPNTDPKYAGIDSKELLREVIELMRSKDFEVGNIDSTVCLEAPKVNPHIPGMQQAIAEICGIESSDVSIKATTSEKLGYVGREEGVFAQAVVLLQSNH